MEDEVSPGKELESTIQGENVPGIGRLRFVPWGELVDLVYGCRGFSEEELACGD
jgi:hypothetical protein